MATRTGKQVAEAWAQSGGSGEAPSYTDAEKWKAALSEREPQSQSVTPHAGGARTVLGNTGPSRSESAAIHVLRVSTVEYARRDDGERWCFGCRARLPHALVFYKPADPMSYYGPHAELECARCKRDRTAFPA